MATPKQKYIRQLNSIANRYGKMEDTTIKRILSMLKELRGEIGGTLTRTPSDRFESFRLGQLRNEINALINQFERNLTSEVSSAMVEAQNDGAQSVTEPLSELGELDEVDIPTGTGQFGIQGQFIRPVAAQANVAVDFTAALIQNIVEPMRARINRELQLAVLGRKSPFDVMVAVTNILGVEARANIWGKRPDPVKGVAARAETDVRTELQRMFNVSHTSQQQVVKQLVPDLLKTWIAAADSRTRRSHLIAHLTYRNNPIPVDEPFILTVTKGKNKGKKFKLMYPTDPAGPPELTINCLPGDALVVAPDVVAATQVMYNGPMVELQVGGEQLTITPNHPVLTPVGFVPAGLLKREDTVVIQSSGGQAPTSIEQVFSELVQSHSSALVHPLLRGDFHGDGHCMAGIVQIAFPKKAPDKINVPAVTRFEEETMSWFARQYRHMESMALPNYAGIANQCFAEFAEFMTFEPVRQVRERHFDGYVYDLQTSREYYLYNGVVPLKNCRCKPASVHPKVGIIGSSLDGRIASEINRRGTRLPPEARQQENVVYSREHGFIVRA